jgi:predicted transcriptional regulator
MLSFASFDDGRGRFPDTLAVNVPRGFKARLDEVARAHRMPRSVFVRDAIEDRLQQVAKGAPKKESR